MRIIDPPVTFGRALVPTHGRAPAGNEATRARRLLDPAVVRRDLPRVGAPPVDALIQLLFDLSGSMTSGNDAAGLRFESALIGLEHLMAAPSRRGRRWSVELRSFDLTSPLELAPIPLERRHAAELRSRLLDRPGNGTSLLRPALRAAEASGAASPARVLVVLSDFELFDGADPDVLDELEASRADLVVAIVLSSRGVPDGLSGRDRLHVHHVHPSDADPAAIAQHLVRTAVTVVEGLRAGEPR